MFITEQERRLTRSSNLSSVCGMPFMLVFLLLGFTEAKLQQCNLTYTKEEWCTSDRRGLLRFCSIDEDGQLIDIELDTGYPSCWWSCGYAVLWPGSCACPNGCYEAEGKGYCNNNNGTEGGCRCNKGWKGDDCSLVDIGNPCSGHGKVKVDDPEIPFRYCACNQNWTGPYCDVPTLQDPLPYYPSVDYEQPYYSEADLFGDNHPLFNISTLTTFHITLPPEDYIYHVQPDLVYNQSYTRVNITFYGGGVKHSLTNVRSRLKGFWTRPFSKKSWKFKLDKPLYGIDTFSLKACIIDNTGIHIPVTQELVRALGIQTYRISWAVAYINEVFAGIFFLQEDIGKDFLTSRFGNYSEGNLYTMNGEAFLQYEGDNQTAYKESWGGAMPGEKRPGWVQYPDEPLLFPYVVWNRYKYDQEEGNGNYSDLVDLVKAINAPVDDKYKKNLEDILNVEETIKGIALDIMTGNWDGYQIAGNNFGVYNMNPPDQKPYFRWIMFDYDWPFLLRTSWFGIPVVNASVYDALGAKTGDYGWNRTLPSRILEVYRPEFTIYLRDLLERVGQEDAWTFDANGTVDRSTVAPSLISRIKSFTNLSLPYTLMDNFGLFDHDRTSPVDEIFGQMIPFVQIRFSSASVQLDPKKPSLLFIVLVSLGVVILVMAVVVFGLYKFRGAKSGYEGISEDLGER